MVTGDWQAAGVTTARGSGRPPGSGGPSALSSHQRAAAPERAHDGRGRPDGPTSLGRGILIVVVALALGIYLVQLGGGKPAVPVSARARPATTAPSSAGKGRASTSTSPTSAPTQSTAPTSTTAGARPNPAVRVLVANASHTTGIAAYYSKVLTSDGWGALTPTNALTVVSTAIVAYQPGQQAAASEIASELGLSASSVAAVSAATPVNVTPSADVVVVVGLNLAAKAPATA